jgi:hypothetical protein
MPKFRLNRRAVLRGAGSIAIALPWLEVMEPEKKAWAAGTPAQRFVAIYTPGGTVRDKYTPTGTETAPVLSPILAPLEPVKSKILIIDGLDMKSAVGEQHQAGICALLTGTPQSAANRNFAGGPSIDQVIATRISVGKKAKPSIQMAVRWATGKSHGLLHPINSLNFEDNAMFSPIPPRLDPVEIFNDLFGTLMPGPNGDPAAIIARKKSILDYVDKRYAALSPRLGVADRMKVEQHLSKIREIEMGLNVTTPPMGMCKAPTKVDTSDYNPRSGLMSSDTGSIVDTPTDAAIPKVGKYLTDMLVMSLACDMTAVASLQWTDTEAKHTFPWLTLPQHHHFYQHDGGFKPVECQQIYTWYSQQHLYLIQQMQAVDMGGHTLLDESVVFFGSELQEPPTHLKGNMPFMLAGNGGGLRTGRWLKFNSLPHNNLLVSILNLFGDTRQTFGTAQYCTGPLTGLT